MTYFFLFFFFLSLFFLVYFLLLSYRKYIMTHNNIGVYVTTNKTSGGTVVLPSMKCHFDGEMIATTTRRRDRSPAQYTLSAMKKNYRRKIIAQWLFFKESRWIPLDLVNYEKLEDTIRIKGTFIDIEDSHFPEVRRVRVFPELDYLSYLGIRYRISKVLLPN